MASVWPMHPDAVVAGRPEIGYADIVPWNKGC